MSRGGPRPPEPTACRSCPERILLVREVDSSKWLVLNATPAEGGTVILLNDREGQIVPAGRGLGFTLHACERSA
jgi:hypothetical protein